MNTALMMDWKDFEESPSRKDGLSQHVERHLRADTCRFIDQFGLKHKSHGWSGRTRLLACSLFHTFYLGVSFKAVPRWEAAIACLTLARKANENDDPAGRKTKHGQPHQNIFKKKMIVDKSGPSHTSGTNRVEKTFLRSAADFLRLNRKEMTRFESLIRMREDQILSGLRCELNMKLPIERKVGYLYSAQHLHPIIVNRRGHNFATTKDKNLSLVFRGCFDILRVMFRSVVCIYYPPPWLAAVAIFKSVKKFNKDRTNDGHKIYLIPKWYKKYDLSTEKKLDLNVIQYISDEIDACDENAVSVKDYMLKPAEMFGVNDRALMERINLIRTIPFQRLPKEIQSDLRDCFRLKEDEFIDLRSQRIQRLEQQILKRNSKAIFNQDIKGDAVSWIFGNGPKHVSIVGDLIQKQKQLMNVNKSVLQKHYIPNHQRKNKEVEEGEIVDDLENWDSKRNNKNRSRSKHRDTPKSKHRESKRIKKQRYRHRLKENKKKKFETKGFQKEKNIKQQKSSPNPNAYGECKYVKHKKSPKNKKKSKSPRSRKPYDEDADGYFMNWIIQRFEFDDYEQCTNTKPEIQRNDENHSISRQYEIAYMIPTPNYLPSGDTPTVLSPGTPGWYAEGGNAQAINDNGYSTNTSKCTSMTPTPEMLNATSGAPVRNLSACGPDPLTRGIDIDVGPDYHSTSITVNGSPTANAAVTDVTPPQPFGAIDTPISPSRFPSGSLKPISEKTEMEETVMRNSDSDDQAMPTPPPPPPPPPILTELIQNEDEDENDDWSRFNERSEFSQSNSGTNSVDSIETEPYSNCNSQRSTPKYRE